MKLIDFETTYARLGKELDFFQLIYVCDVVISLAVLFFVMMTDLRGGMMLFFATITPLFYVIPKLTNLDFEKEKLRQEFFDSYATERSEAVHYWNEFVVLYHKHVKLNVSNPKATEEYYYHMLPTVIMAVLTPVDVLGLSHSAGDPEVFFSNMRVYLNRLALSGFFGEKVRLIQDDYGRVVAARQAVFDNADFFAQNVLKTIRTRIYEEESLAKP